MKVNILFIGLSAFFISTAAFSESAHDTKLRELAKQYPNFAGIHQDSLGNTIISITDPQTQHQQPNLTIKENYSKQQAKHIALNLLSSLQDISPGKNAEPNYREKDVFIRKVSYSFALLYDWNTKIKSSLLEQSGVIETKINKQENNITVSVSKYAYLGELENLFLDYGIPRSAYSFEVSNNDRIENERMQNKSARS